MNSCFLKSSRAAAVGLVLILTSLSAQPETSIKPDQLKSEGGRGDYVLQPQDVVKVQVLREEELTRELRISQESTITLPLIGTVDLKDKTVRQAEEVIRALYDRDYLVNPQVNLSVTDYSKKNLNVLGCVGNPGVVNFPQEQGLNLIDAISRAGGFTRLANKSKVTLKRTNADGSVDTKIIDAEELTKGKTTNTWPLQPGDVIVVPERAL